MNRPRLRSRRRRRYDQEPPARVLGRGLAVLAVLVVLGWLSATLYNGVPGRDYRMVDAEVPQIGNLIGHDPVRMGGVRVGQVKSVGTAPGGLGHIEMQIEPGTEIPADTQIRVRANGLLGARYVELIPGPSARELAAGTVLRGDEHALTYGVTDALDVFDRETRGALKSMMGELGTGLMGQGRNVNDLLRVGGREIDPTTELFRELRHNAGPVDRLLPSLESAAVPLDAERERIAALFGQADAALAPFVRDRDATRRTLDEAPSALAAADSGLSAARPLLAAARRLSSEVRTTLPGAAPGLRAATALLVEAREPLRRARPLLAAVEPTVPAALRLTKAADPLLIPLKDLFADLRSAADKIAPYGCDIRNFGTVFRSMTGLGNSAPGGPAGPAMQFRLQAVGAVASEQLSMTDTSGLVVRDGYPRPCRYLSKPYPIIERPQTLLRRGR